MKNKITISVLLFAVQCFAQSNVSNPYASIGKEAKVLTLSNGRYTEFFDNDTLQRIGSVMFNTVTNKIEYFIDENDKLIVFLEDDISISKYSVIRGLHGDNNTWKLVQCLSGEIHINIVDYRKGSSTYMNAESFKLKDVYPLVFNKFFDSSIVILFYLFLLEILNMIFV